MADVEVTIPLLDDTCSKTKIEQLETDKETLEIWDSPLGGNKEHCKVIHNKMKLWINCMKNGQLPSHVACIGYRLQLWAGF